MHRERPPYSAINRGIPPYPALSRDKKISWEKMNHEWTRMDTNEHGFSQRSREAAKKRL